MNEIIKSEGLINPGYIFVPYTIVTSNPIICSDFFYGKKSSRKSKINKIFELGLDIKTSITSRYTKKVLNSKFYQTIEIKNPLN